MVYAANNTIIDSRDGRQYKIVRIGKQTWMAENLKFNTRPSFCYQGSDANCQKYGRMYPWHVAMKLPPQKAYDNDNVKDYVKDVHQGICPTGWHIPSVAEFDTLYAEALAGDESPSTKKLSTDPTERFILNPKGFNLKYGGQLQILGFSYYRGFVESDPTAAARFFKTGKSGEYPLKYVFRDINHFVAFATKDAEEAVYWDYTVYSDQYHFEMTSGIVYRGANAPYIRCIKDFECPKDEELYEGICQKPFACSEYEYAVDKWNCKILPPNAHKNKDVGFSCDEGYNKIKKDGAIECMQPYGCKEKEYAINKYECGTLPDNAHRKENEKTGFECDDGYDKVQIGLFTYCRIPYVCKENEYSLDKHKCKKLPSNARRNEKEGFSCNDGYAFYQGECYPRSP